MNIPRFTKPFQVRLADNVVLSIGHGETHYALPEQNLFEVAVLTNGHFDRNRLADLLGENVEDLYDDVAGYVPVATIAAWLAKQTMAVAEGE